VLHTVDFLQQGILPPIHLRSQLAERGHKVILRAWPAPSHGIASNLRVPLNAARRR
jgi:hypothetical protein